jgi:S1-C subfamily serine protease
MSSYTYSNDPYRRTRTEPRVYWPLILLLAAIGVGVWHFWPRSNGGVNVNAEPRPIAPRGNLLPEEQETIDIFKNASPSVVHITTLVQQQDFFSFDVQEIPRGTGSGFIWDDDGHIVTNFHVVKDGDSFKVILADGSKYDARVVGAYPDHDLAVLGIEAPKGKLQPIRVGTSHDLQVGQKVLAIGNPFGLDQTLTTGIVSALGREIESVTRRRIKNVIQTDAAINPGNSGGPLLDSGGRLIGVNTAIYSPSGTSAGIGFAIPVDDVNRDVPQLIRYRKIVRPWLGIVPADDRLARRNGLEGVLIMSIKRGSPAAQAGLLPIRRDRFGDLLRGDLVVAIDGKPIKSTDDFYSALEAHKVGDTVTVTVVRNDERQDFQIALSAAE